MICNILLFAVKLFVGLFLNAISVISDAFNNLTDSFSSIVSIISAKLSNKISDNKNIRIPPKQNGEKRILSADIALMSSKKNNNDATAIFINQLREKVGVMFGNPETTTGGNALKFYSSMRLEVRKSTAIKDGDEVLADDYSNLNQNSLVEMKHCKLEAAFNEVEGIERFQFLRNGYFCVDSKDSTKEHPVYNRIVSLKSSYRPK